MVDCTLNWEDSLRVYGNTRSRRFLGREYATMKSVIFIEPPLGCGKLEKEAPFLLGVFQYDSYRERIRFCEISSGW